MKKLHICPKCLKAYKRSRVGRKARKNGGQWGRGKWPSFIYHEGAARLCEKHATAAMAEGAKRRASKLNATPAWADLGKVRAIYAEARRLTKETGIRHEVDHIHPLQGRTVSGLHVETNLQVITAAEKPA